MKKKLILPNRTKVLPNRTRKTKSTAGMFKAMGRASLDNKLAAFSIHIENYMSYGINLRDRVLNLTGPIEHPVSFDILDVALTEMEAESKRKTITIKINSGGGDVYEALAMVARIRKCPCHIITEGYGHVMSAATLILASGDKRYMSQLGFFMNHEQSYDPGYARHSQHVNYVKQAEREEFVWCSTMATFTNKDAQFWKENGTYIDAYFDAQQLKEHGVIDETF